jgi:hypothetical protein
MQVFHEHVQYFDPPRPPTPSQKLFRAWLMGGEKGLAEEYEKMHPSKPEPEEAPAK